MKALAVFMPLLFCVTSNAAQDKIVLNTKNTLVFRGAINDSSVLRAQLELVKLVAYRGLDTYPIYLVFDSGGGSIDAGNDFIQFAKTIKNLKTVSLFAASMASAIVQALPGERLMTENGFMMFHRARATVSGQVETGELETQLALIKRLILKLENSNANRIGLSLAEYKERVVNEWWLDDAQAIQQKTADRIIDISCTQQLIEKKEAVEISLFMFSASLNYSGCPLFRTPLP